MVLKIEFNSRAMQPSACGSAAQQCTVAQSQTYAINVDASVYPEVLVLLGMLVACRVVTYYALNLKTTFKKG